MSAQIFLLHAVEPLHPGIGQGAGTIDLPISREKPTNWPRQVGSGIKGPLRDAFPVAAEGEARGRDEARRDAIFGKDGDGGTGAAQFADARILLFPLASWRGTFAYVTSPLVLRFYIEDVVRRCNGPRLSVPVVSPGRCVLPNFARTSHTDWKEKLSFQAPNTQGENQLIVALDEFDIAAELREAAGTWAVWLGQQLFPGTEPAQIAGQKRVAERFCVVDDDIFSALVRTGTEVIARIRLDDNTKSVVDGMLWYEELLPRETVLAGVMTATPLRVHQLSEAEVLEKAVSTPLVQIGGKASVGRGHCRLLVPTLQGAA